MGYAIKLGNTGQYEPNFKNISIQSSNGNLTFNPTVTAKTIKAKGNTQFRGTVSFPDGSYEWFPFTDGSYGPAGVEYSKTFTKTIVRYDTYVGFGFDEMIFEE